MTDNAGAKIFTGFDLGRGAVGVDHANDRQIQIRPCSTNGKYAGVCHVLIAFEGDMGEQRCRRTLDGIREEGIAAWLHQSGGIEVDAVEWSRGDWEPTPDTYRADRELASEIHEFWRELDRAMQPDPDKVAKALEPYHDRLKRFIDRETLPSYRERLRKALAIVAGEPTAK